MKQTLLLVVLLFTAASAPCQTNTGLVPGAPTYQQQFDSESGNQQLHDIPPQQPPAQPGTGSSSASERWRYDPAVKPGSIAKRPFLESPIERALKGINPCNVPYGRLLDEWRAMVVQETIENVKFWLLLVLIASMMLSGSYTVWLLREREDRLQIAGGIVAQLWNAHVFARGKALEATEAHKRLVEVNAEDRAARERSAQQRANASDASKPPRRPHQAHMSNGGSWVKVSVSPTWKAVCAVLASHEGILPGEASETEPLSVTRPDRSRQRLRYSR